MRVLVIGGTVFVGRRTVEALVSGGHDVTLLNRGVSGTSPSPSLRELRADREDPAALAAALAGGEWDLTIDVCAYGPGHVHDLADGLSGRGGHYALVSTISVYDVDAGEGPITEDSPLLSSEGSDYGSQKVACEQAAATRFESPLVVRPGVVAGAHDRTGRFSWYVRAFEHAGDGPVDLPGDPSDPMQVIDARDLGLFIADAAMRGLHGAYNATGYDACRTIGDIAAAAREVTGSTAAARWISHDELLASADVSGVNWPLWIPPGESVRRMFEIDPARARDAGLRCRPLAHTALDVLVE